MTVTAPPDALSDPARRFLAGPHELRIGGERVAAHRVAAALKAGTVHETSLF
jgi:hypothetical protein